MGTVGENPGDDGRRRRRRRWRRRMLERRGAPLGSPGRMQRRSGVRVRWPAPSGIPGREQPRRRSPARRDRVPPAGVKPGRKRQPRSPQRVPWRRAPRKGARTGTYRCPSWLTPPGRAGARAPSSLPELPPPGDRLDNGYPNIIPWGPGLRDHRLALARAGRDAPYWEAGDPERGAGGGRAGGCLGRGGGG